jgi:outer membrane protein assembly factor BamE (lipoprotein component of BamABCDE complex)
MKNKILKWQVAIYAFLITGCGVEPLNQGNLIEPNKVKAFIGKATKQDIEAEFGSPSVGDPKNSSVFYYAGAVGYKKALMQPQIKEKRLLRLEYDKNNVLISVLEIK